MVAALLLLLAPFVQIDVLKQKFPQTVAGLPHLVGHDHPVLTFAVAHYVGDHGVDPLAMGLAQHLHAGPRQLVFLQNAAADSVVDVVADVGNAVSPAHAPALQRGRLLRPGVT